MRCEEKYVTIRANGKKYKVWTESRGGHPSVKVLIVHGGPGACHHIYGILDDWFPETGYEYILYDQLGSCCSDKPDDTSLWTIDRFVDEIEEVRKAWNLDESDFYLYGGSWGGILAMEYAIKYPDHLKALIIHGMVDSFQYLMDYQRDVLLVEMGEDYRTRILALDHKDNRTDDEEKELSTIRMEYLTKYFLRTSWDPLPGPIQVAFQHGNMQVAETLIGLKDFEVSGTGANWDVSDRLHEINVPTLFMASKYDVADPDRLRWMSNEVQSGYYHLCPEAGHCSPYSDTENFFKGLFGFIREVEKGTYETDMALMEKKNHVRT